MKTKTSKSSSKKSSTKSSGKSVAVSSKKAKRLAREAKRAARKGDGTFPDLIVLSQEKTKEGKKYFAAHDGEKMDTLYDNGQAVAIYKLRRVSTMVINRKVAR